MNLLGWLLSRNRVRKWLITRAQLTPYYHLADKGGGVYMYRWWLFNGLRADGKFRWPNLPSIRIHHIMRRDLDRHKHDHPANCRTFILQGSYDEDRDTPNGTASFQRTRGDSAAIKFGEFHTITRVGPGGVWTMFVLGPRKGMWGFKVDGVKVPFREYLDKHGSDA